MSIYTGVLSSAYHPSFVCSFNILIILYTKPIKYSQICLYNSWLLLRLRYIITFCKFIKLQFKLVMLNISKIIQLRARKIA